MWVFLACELLQKNFCMFNWPQRYPTHQEYTYSLHRLGRMARSWPGGTIFVPFLAVHGSLLAPGLLIDLTPTSIPARGWPCILLILLQAICGPHVWHFFFGLRRRMFGVSLPLYLLHLSKQFCLRPCLACLAWMAWAIWSSWSLIKSTLHRFKITEQSSVCTLMPAWCQSDSHALDQILPDPSGDLGRMILVSQLVIGMDVK